MIVYSPEFPNTLEDVPVGAFFEMLNYDGRYQRVQLPEPYRLGPNRQPLTSAMFDGSYVIEVTKDGDGHHLPILGTDGQVFLMSKIKPVRILPRGET